MVGSTGLHGEPQRPATEAGYHDDAISKCDTSKLMISTWETSLWGPLASMVSLWGRPLRLATMMMQYPSVTHQNHWCQHGKHHGGVHWPPRSASEAGYHDDAISKCDTSKSMISTWKTSWWGPLASMVSLWGWPLRPATMMMQYPSVTHQNQ